MLDALHAFGAQTLGAAWPTIWLLARILALSVALLLCVAYLILWERKLIAWMHVRHGPNRVGPRGLLQPIAVYGVILAGWASNSKYAFLGAMRAAAQMVSYEIAMGFALVVVLLTSGSLNLSDIVYSQQRGLFAGWGLNLLSWNWLPLLPMLGVFFISGIAETARHPFDVVEGESEIVAGHMVD